MIKLPLRRSDPAATDRVEARREELPHARGQGSGQEELPHVQGAAALRAQEGQEELLHVQGQEGLQ